MLFNFFRGLLGTTAVGSIKPALRVSRTVLPIFHSQMDACATQKYHVYKWRKWSPNQHKLTQYIYCTWQMDCLSQGLVFGFFAEANLSRKDNWDCAWTRGLHSSCKWRCRAGKGCVGGAGRTHGEGGEGQSLVLWPCQEPLGDVGAACGAALLLPAPETPTMADRQWVSSLVF